jgi:alpha-tubulin suppressor-like RCC1 family protein
LSRDQIAAGDEHTCSIRNGGEVWCWGKNDRGQLGNGSTGGQSKVPGKVPGISSATAVVAGRDFTCAVVSFTTVTCWGDNNQGQLGNGTTASPGSSPTTVSGISGVFAIAAGEEHACVVSSALDVWCWGRNDRGQLGSGLPSGGNATTPQRVSGLSAYSAIAAGDKHTCAVTTSGGVRCWGHNNHGQLGNNLFLDSNIPVTVVSLGGAATAVGAGKEHSCAALSGEAPVCWGNGDHGRLGHSGGGDDPAPVEVDDLGEVQVIVGGDEHTCAATDMEVWCWGRNDKGQLGDGSKGDTSDPVTVMSPTSVGGIAAGGKHSCYIDETRDAWCWGHNNNGQLGDGTASDSDVPVSVTWP